MKQDIRPKKATHASQSTLFLIELIISVAFMALSSTVCVRLYLYAHELSTYSAFRTHAVTEVQNLFTAFRTGSGTPADTLKQYLATVSFAGTASSDTASGTDGSVFDSGLSLPSDLPSTANGLSYEESEEVSVTLFFDRSWNFCSCSRGGREGIAESASDTASVPYRLTLTWTADTDTPGMEILTAEVRNTQQDPEPAAYHAECRRYFPRDSVSESSSGAAESSSQSHEQSVGKEVSK